MSADAEIADAVERLRPELERLARELYDEPEIGFEEHASVARIASLLAAHGVDVEVGAFGLATALNYAASGLVDWPVAFEFIAGGILGGIFE